MDKLHGPNEYKWKDEYSGKYDAGNRRPLPPASFLHQYIYVIDDIIRWRERPDIDEKLWHQPCKPASKNITLYCRTYDKKRVIRAMKAAGLAVGGEQPAERKKETTYFGWPPKGATDCQPS